MTVRRVPVHQAGPLCGQCGEPFTEAEWEDRHDNGDDLNWQEWHADCCPYCWEHDRLCAGCDELVVVHPAVHTDRGVFCSAICAARADEFAEADRAFVNRVPNVTYLPGDTP